ncbi:MAG: hypothetical protein JWM41_4290 [Gemmatimonadetes bacterium]|nr:hypothetical protein [Gemmatimonadota bacterium]
MRPLLAMMVVALSACASANTPPHIDAPETVRISGGGTGTMQMSTTPNAAPNVATVAAPIDAVWRAMPLAFDSLGILTNTVDPAAHVIGNTGMKIRRQLGKVPLSKYLDCGSTQGPPSADTYEIQFSVITQLTPAAGGATTVTTTIDGRGRPVTMAGEYSRCSSKGTLEQAIAAVARSRVAR